MFLLLVSPSLCLMVAQILVDQYDRLRTFSASPYTFFSLANKLNEGKLTCILVMYTGLFIIIQLAVS